ncbi:hypothetical protein [Jeotgalibacillus proteolyticus]|uniref:N-acetyltransferase n=1 Tax=Jeotgalibacillus proteolyticus TaxID=2082395 RepID=A0A2S5G8Q4_9BACL|nr:hypothetical protein [Jeotgalibacillus proteolyticus]PPA69382.1 hypothetical protein C4B60_16440 [Jeotgalibacillus proteolyticus]
MFEIVKTLKQQKKFQETWENVCKQNGWVNDPYAKDGVRYNLLAQARFPFLAKNVIGTIEFTPYDPANPNSTVEGPERSKFSIYEDILQHQSRTWEIDKLCLQEGYQRKGYFPQFLNILHDHAVTYSPKYYIALIEKKFYRMLKITYGVAIEQRGEPLKGPGTSLIPMVFDVEKVMADAGTVERLLREAGEGHRPLRKNG